MCVCVCVVCQDGENVACLMMYNVYTCELVSTDS